MIGRLFLAGMIAAVLAGSAVFFGAATSGEMPRNFQENRAAVAKYARDFLDRFDNDDAVDVSEYLDRTAPARPVAPNRNSTDLAGATGTPGAEPLPDLPDLRTDAELTPYERALRRARDRRDDTPTIDDSGDEDGPRRLVTPIDVLIAEAEKISIDAARDDAYLNIIDYALSQDLTDVGTELTDRLSSPELRDTARQRIGISHALNGRVSEAFAIIETLEITELADPIRLEIIRAASGVR